VSLSVHPAFLGGQKALRLWSSGSFLTSQEPWRERAVSWKTPNAIPAPMGKVSEEITFMQGVILKYD
jgi:hypothetical protein